MLVGIPACGAVGVLSKHPPSSADPVAFWANDIAARLGGDEFIVLLPGAGPAVAEAVADRLRTTICQPVDVGGQIAHVGVSIGVACRGPGDAAGVKELTGAADAAMYRGKVAR